MTTHKPKIPDEQIKLAHSIAALMYRDSPSTTYAKLEIAKLYSRLSQGNEIGVALTRKFFLEIADGVPSPPKKTNNDSQVRQRLKYIFNFLKSRGKDNGFHVGLYNVASALQKHFPGVYAKRGHTSNADALEAEAIGQKLERYFLKEPK